MSTETQEDAYQKIYDEAIANGCCAIFADMLASRKAPGTKGCDTDWFRGKGTLSDQFSGDQKQLEHTVNVARSHGYNPNMHDVYVPGMARFVGDPEAFVSPAGGLHQVKSTFVSRNQTCHGAVEFESVKMDPPKDAKPVLCEKLVEKLSVDMAAADPKLAKKGKRALREAVIDKHAYPAATY